MEGIVPIGENLPTNPQKQPQYVEKILADSISRWAENILTEKSVIDSCPEGHGRRRETFSCQEGMKRKDCSPDLLEQFP